MTYLLDFIKKLLAPHSVGKNLLLTSFMVFLIVAICLVASWGTTGVSVIQPRQLMLKWADNKTTFSEKKWRSALIKLHSAIEDNPNNAEHYFDLARLYEWNAYQKPIWADDATKHRTQAIKYYIRSLEHRPTWSSAWVNLAMSKTLNLEFGDDVKTALSNAMTYGPWERGVFHKVLWISLANWKGLPLSLQEQVKARIKETVSSKGRVPKYIQQTAKHFNWHEELDEIISQVKDNKI